MGTRWPYTPEIGDAICEWISAGKTLREFCRQKGSPSWSTVYNWREESADFRTRFARARDLGADAIAEEALAIADTPLEGVRTEESELGIKRIRDDMLGHRKLQVETRLKLLAKWHPKKYGDKITQEISGPDGSPVAIAAMKATTDPNQAAALYSELVGDAPKSE